MAALEDFEKILKEVVDVKRLSASKMNALTEIAMKNMENDAQLVSILYRTHKSLPNISKVSGLYIFDALSRAARHHVVKHGISGDVYTQPGNCATFLLKVGGVVEGLFQDMVTSGSSESKEKTKKILNIWMKGNTFPPTILSQLSNILKPTDKVLDPAPTIDPRMNMHPPFNPPATVIQSPLTPPLDPQAALLALLIKAAASSGKLSTSQMITNVEASAQLDATQLAVLQQLAHTAAYVPSVPQTLPLPEPVNVQNFPSGVSGCSHSLLSLHRDGHRSWGRGDNLTHKDNRRDRDSYRTSEKDRSSRRGGRSRSRSPPSRYGGRRFSQRTRFVSPSQRQESLQGSTSSRTENDSGSGKDEFGRDIRLQSLHSKSLPYVAHETSLPAPSPPTTINKPRVESRSSLAVTVSRLVTANADSNKPTSAPLVSNTVPYSELDMDNLDRSTFDYTSPTSWETLEKMLKVIYLQLNNYQG